MARRKKIKSEETVNEIDNAITENTNTEMPDMSNDEPANVGESDAENTDTNTNVETVPDFTADLSEIDKIISESKNENGEKRGRKSKEEKQKVALKLPGSLFVRVHNSVASNAIGLLESFVAKKNAIDSSLISLDEKTIQELAPYAELAMKEMKIEENPIAAFYIMFGSAILANYANVKAMIRNAMKENPNFDISKITDAK